MRSRDLKRSRRRIWLLSKWKLWLCVLACAASAVDCFGRVLSYLCCFMRVARTQFLYRFANVCSVAIRTINLVHTTWLLLLCDAWLRVWKMLRISIHRFWCYFHIGQIYLICLVNASVRAGMYDSAANCFLLATVVLSCVSCSSISISCWLLPMVFRCSTVLFAAAFVDLSCSNFPMYLLRWKCILFENSFYCCGHRRTVFLAREIQYSINECPCCVHIGVRWMAIVKIEHPIRGNMFLVPSRWNRCTFFRQCGVQIINAAIILHFDGEQRSTELADIKPFPMMAQRRIRTNAMKK